MLILLWLLYGLPGYLIPLYLSALAFLKIQQSFRFFFLAAAVVFYVLPPLIPALIPWKVLFGVRLLLGIIGYLCLTYKRIPLKFWVKD